MVKAKLTFILHKIDGYMLKRILILLVAFFVTITVLAQPPRTAINLYKTGKKLIEQGMFYEAMQSFKKAIVFYKNYDSAYLEWSNLYIRMNKPDSAIYVWSRAVKLNPGMVAGYNALGKLYRDKKQNFDSARVNFIHALKIDSTNKELFYNVAWCYNAVQDYDNAILYAVKALELDVNYKPPYSELAHAIRFSKKFDEGLVLFKKYSAISTCELPLFYSGLLYMESGRYDDLQKTIDELTKKGFIPQADGLKKRWEAKKNLKPAQGS